MSLEQNKWSDYMLINFIDGTIYTSQVISFKEFYVFQIYFLFAFFKWNI